MDFKRVLWFRNLKKNRFILHTFKVYILKNMPLRGFSENEIIFGVEAIFMTRTKSVRP